MRPAGAAPRRSAGRSAVVGAGRGCDRPQRLAIRATDLQKACLRGLSGCGRADGRLQRKWSWCLCARGWASVPPDTSRFPATAADQAAAPQDRRSSSRDDVLVPRRRPCLVVDHPGARPMDCRSVADDPHHPTIDMRLVGAACSTEVIVDTCRTRFSVRRRWGGHPQASRRNKPGAATCVGWHLPPRGAADERSRFNRHFLG